MGEFSPWHWALVLFVTVIMFGMPFLAGYFIGRYVELKKSKRP
jgi:predicted Na+-dependent transporter